MSKKENPLSILRDIWSQNDISELDAECNPNKICKNMQEVTVGFTTASWKEQLKKDNKWREDNG